MSTYFTRNNVMKILIIIFILNIIASYLAYAQLTLFFINQVLLIIFVKVLFTINRKKYDTIAQAFDTDGKILLYGYKIIDIKMDIITVKLDHSRSEIRNNAIIETIILFIQPIVLYIVYAIIISITGDPDNLFPLFGYILFPIYFVLITDFVQFSN